MLRAMLVLLIALPFAVAGQTTGTLRMGQVFARPTPSIHPIAPEVRINQDNLHELLSDDDRLTTPLKQRIGEVYPEGLPHIPPRGFGNKPAVRTYRRPALVERGRNTRLPAGYMRLETTNQFRALNTRIEITPVGSPPIVYLLAPGEGEIFLLPEGRYTAVIEAWEPQNPQARIREEYPDQPTRERWNYYLELKETKEQLLLRDLAGRRPSIN